MSSDIKPTNARSSGVSLDRDVLKSLARRSDRPGLIWLGQWGLMLLATGSFVYLSAGTWWLLPAMIVYGTALTVPCYALSHETAHGTTFKTRWLNEAMFFISSFLFFERAVSPPLRAHKPPHLHLSHR